jgi:hypothetical protein
MDHRVHAGGRGHMAGQAYGQQRIEHGVLRNERARGDTAFLVARQGDDRDRRRFRSGAGGRRHQHEGKGGSGRVADAPDIVERIARSEQIGGKLGDIHRAAAAEADHRSNAGFAPTFDCGFERRARRIGLDPIEYRDLPTACCKPFERRRSKAQPKHMTIRDEQHRAFGQPCRELRRHACSRGDLRAIIEGEALHSSPMPCLLALRIR